MRNRISLNKSIVRSTVCFFITLVIMLFSLNSLSVSAVNFEDVEDNDRGSSSITIDIASGDAENSSSALDLLFLLALLALIPSILIMATSYTRIIIAFSFLRNAMGTQSSPPNQVLTGLALFMTIFIMMPVINEMNEDVYKPYVAGQMSQEEVLTEGVKPLKKFMLKQVYKEDLNMFMEVADSKEVINIEEYNSQDKLTELSIFVIMPSFILSEIKRGFLIGFLLYIPFLVIDLIVSSVLMSMGMMMLPPSMISLPFKIMLFIMADGWELLVQSLIAGFNT